MDPEGIAAAVRAERLSLCDILDQLSSDEWEVSSLCAAWNVREVVAHLTVTTRATVGLVLKEALKARGNFDRMATNIARRRAAVFHPRSWCSSCGTVPTRLAGCRAAARWTH